MGNYTMQSTQPHVCNIIGEAYKGNLPFDPIILYTRQQQHKILKTKRSKESLQFIQDTTKNFRTVVKSQIEIGDTYFRKHECIQAISYYSRAFINLQNNFKVNKPKTKELFPIYEQLYHSVCSIVINNRAQCYIELNKYEKALRDLNWIIRRSYAESTLNDLLLIKEFMLSSCAQALFRRAQILFILGNSAASIHDHLILISAPFHRHSNVSNVRKICAMKHPSKSTLPKYNKYTRKLNKFSRNGWIKLNVATDSNPLPFKQGHSMIVHKDKIYCFGGVDVHLGKKTISRNEYSRNIVFLQISIIKKNKQYAYIWKQLIFPKTLKFLINGQLNTWSRLVTVNKWRNKMILCGGNDPLFNVLTFDFLTKKWNHLIIVQKIHFTAPNFIANHAAVIMNDNLYILGGYNNLKSLFCLHLLTRKWKKMSAMPNLSHGFDHLMWKDTHYGKLGSLFVAFGSFESDNWANNWQTKEIPPQMQRRNIWRFAVYKNKWFRHLIHGNFPIHRVESGFTETDDGIIVFGGYNSRLLTINEESQNRACIGSYAFFSDCFEYSNNTQKWKMIHSNTIPPHRSFSAMCELNNLIVLYGGTHGGTKEYNQVQVYNDIWILQKNKIKFHPKKNVLKFCQICRKTNNEVRLYVCGRCKTEQYCSKICQKIGWSVHKPHCTDS
eukprot:15954_1